MFRKQVICIIIIAFFNLVPPKIENQEESTVVCGSNAPFDFIITGVPTPKVTVFKDDQLVPETEHYQISYEKEKLTLTIKSVVLEDEGAYKITAENKAGQAASTVKLITQGILIVSFLTLLKLIGEDTVGP